MNLYRMNILHQTLEGKLPFPEGLRFNMRSVYDDWIMDEPPTICIAGLTIVLFGNEPLSHKNAYTSGAMNLLELSHEQSMNLFFNEDKFISLKRLGQITMAEAADAVLRTMQDAADTVSENVPVTEYCDFN